MENINEFQEWLDKNTNFTKKTKSNIKSRLKRANLILPFQNTNEYIFYLTNEMKKLNLSISVRSQIKKSVLLYKEFIDKK